MKVRFENFSNHFNEREIIPFVIGDENVHPKELKLLQINTEPLPQRVFQLKTIRQAFLVNRPIDHNIDEVHSNQSMLTEKPMLKDIELQLKQPLLFPIQL